MPRFVPKSKLPRLAPEFYRGTAVVFWTHTFEDRATGWLDEKCHARFREVLLHGCARYALACPIYVLLPDHWHLVWMGLANESDQRLASAFLRKNLAPFLGASRLQDRAHDHVVREDERKRDAFTATCDYIRQNPVRAGLVNSWQEWPYTGAKFVGYPELEIRAENFWDIRWRIYNSRVVAI